MEELKILLYEMSNLGMRCMLSVNSDVITRSGAHIEVDLFI